MEKYKEIPGTWNGIQIRLKEKWGILTDKDVTLRNGDYEDVLNRLEFILGHSKADLHRIISQFAETEHSG
jgi:hypothetical protein